MADQAHAVSLISCPVCTDSNPSINTFCGKCGARIDPQAAVLEGQIEATIKRLLKDRNVVEIEITQGIAARLTEWIKLFAFFAAIPLAFLLGGLAIWGVTKFADVNEKLQTAKTTAESLQNKATVVSDQYARLQQDAAKYESISNQLNAVVAKSDALTRDLQSVKTDVSQIGKRIGFTPSAVLTPDLQKRLEKGLAEFDRYLLKLGYHPDEGKVEVSVVDKIENGTSLASFYPDQRRMIVTARYASEEANVLREYMAVVLKQKQGQWEQWGSYHATEIGLAHYFPASFLNTVPEGSADSWPKNISNTAEINQAGRALSNALWMVRKEIDHDSLDRAILKSWNESQNSNSDPHYVHIFVGQLVQNLGPGGQRVKAILDAQGIK